MEEEQSEKRILSDNRSTSGSQMFVDRRLEVSVQGSIVRSKYPSVFVQ
jgi:hypothetical protein